jgi:hypothetical protein
VWKNYEELEESISLPELLATLEAVREGRKHLIRAIFGAQGIDIDESDPGTKTVEDVMLEALGKDTGIANDVVNLQGAAAEAEGFGIGNGLLYGGDQI